MPWGGTGWTSAARRSCGGSGRISPSSTRAGTPPRSGRSTSSTARNRREEAESVTVLIAGESWMTHSIHVKGVDSFTTSSYEEGVGYLRAALEGGDFEV